MFIGDTCNERIHFESTPLSRVGLGHNVTLIPPVEDIGREINFEIPLSIWLIETVAVMGQAVWVEGKPQAHEQTDADNNKQPEQILSPWSEVQLLLTPRQ